MGGHGALFFAVAEGEDQKGMLEAKVSGSTQRKRSDWSYEIKQKKEREQEFHQGEGPT